MDSTSTCPGLKCLVLQRAVLTLKIKYTFKRKALESCALSWCSTYPSLENILLLLQKHSVESHHVRSCSLSLTQKPDTKSLVRQQMIKFYYSLSTGHFQLQLVEVFISNLYIGLSLTSFIQKSPFRCVMDASFWIRYYVFTWKELTQSTKEFKKPIWTSIKWTRIPVFLMLKFLSVSASQQGLPVPPLAEVST